MVRGQVNISVEVQISGWRKGTGHEGSRRLSEDKCLLDFNGAKVKRVDLPSKATFWVVLLVKISIRKE